MRLEEENSVLRGENEKLLTSKRRLEREINESKAYERQIKDEMRDSIPMERHNMAVKECQEAFEELKKNYMDDTEEKEKIIEKLKKENINFKEMVENASSNNIQLETELKLTQKMMTKFEELSVSLQVIKIYLITCGKNSYNILHTSMYHTP